MDAVLESLKWLSLPCEDFQYRAGNACDADGLAPGTVLDFFAMEGFMGAFPRDDVRESISYDLDGRNPRLAAAVERDRSVTLAFLLDPAPDLVFPGGEPAGGAEEIAVVFGTTATEQEYVTVYDHRFEGSPPLEFLRYDQYVSGTDVTILGLSDEYRGLEQAWHEDDESHRQDGLAR